MRSAVPSITLAFAPASRCASISSIYASVRSSCSSLIALTPPECSNFISRGTSIAQTFKYAAGDSRRTRLKTSLPCCCQSSARSTRNLLLNARRVASGETTPKMPTSSFPSAADQSALLASTASSSASGRPPRCPSRSTRTCCAMPVGSSSPTMATTRGPYSTTSGTRTSSTRSGTPRWRLIASRTFGVDRCRRRQARRRFPLYHLRALRLGLHRRLKVLDHGLKLLVRQLFERVAVLDLVLARHQQREDLEICRRLRPAHLRNGLLPVLAEIAQ